MQRLKHTPEPWRVRKWAAGRAVDGFATAITDNRGHGIVTFCQYGENAKVRANAKIIAAAPTMFRKLADTVAWLDREIKNRRDTRNRMDDEVNQFMNIDTGFQLERLIELRDDLAETLKKITEGE